VPDHASARPRPAVLGGLGRVAAIAEQRTHRWLGNPWVQRALIVAVVVWVFWDGIFAGVPRSDQVLYLHQVGRFDNLWDILSHAPDWNRTTPGNDFILYRPVLYLLLGTFYYAFRYHFVAWQIAALCLHAAVVLGLHLLLLQGRLKQTLYPLAICLLFATSFFGSELVLWNHIVGYVLFCALEVYAVYFFLGFLRTDRIRWLIACGLLSTVAEFTYEAGALVTTLFAATLFARSLSRRTAAAPGVKAGRPLDRWSALMFLAAALLLPLASLIDLRAKGFIFSPQLHGTQPWNLVLLAAEASVHQLAFWFSAWLVPSAYHVVALARAINPSTSFALTPLRLLNLLALGLLAAGIISGLRQWRPYDASERKALFALALSILFLLGYSTIIAVGRTVPKGTQLVLHANIYYAYMAYLTICIGLAAASVVAPGRQEPALAGGEPGPAGAGAGAGRANHRAEAVRRLVPALVLLSFVNACGVRELARAYRYDFDATRQEVIDRVIAWQKQVGTNSQRYFRVSSTCSGNETFWWFDQMRLRAGSGWVPPVTLADALFPEHSANLNAARLHIDPQSVDEISCDANTAGR
jgi:hypothetical protein